MIRITAANRFTAFQQTLQRLVCFSLGILLFATHSVSASDSPDINQPVLSCDFGHVFIDISFSSARLNSCRQTGENTFSVSTAPENVPVNPSPWYAFKVYSEQRQRISLYLNYPVNRHRYVPKLSDDGQNWRIMDQDDMQLLFDGKSLKMQLDVGPDGLWVAAQEIINNRDYENYIRELAELPFLERRRLGNSLGGRAIEMLETSYGSDRYIMLIGRQHPPEITGAQGMKDFVERILRDEPLANAFREKFGLLIIPNMNPDGVELGFWRHNLGGVDLNRDWGSFIQPETRLVRDELERFLSDDAPQLSLFLDFHSTNRDVFYTETREMTRFIPDFTPTWLDQVQQRMREFQADYEVEVAPGYSEDSGVAKNWISRVFGIPAVTVEYGDNTPRPTINRLSVIAAEEMMTLMLSITATDSSSAPKTTQ